RARPDPFALQMPDILPDLVCQPGTVVSISTPEQRGPPHLGQTLQYETDVTHRITLSEAQRSASAVPQESPTPKPHNSASWPGLARPLSMARLRATGIEADTRFPVSARSHTIFSGGISRAERRLSRASWLAWWNTNRSMSPNVRPLRETAVRTAHGTVALKNESTPRPSMVMCSAVRTFPLVSTDSWAGAAERRPR